MAWQNAVGTRFDMAMANATAMAVVKRCHHGNFRHTEGHSSICASAPLVPVVAGVNIFNFVHDLVGVFNH